MVSRLRASAPLLATGSGKCYSGGVKPVEALYEDGILRPAKPLNLRPGERVGVIVVRQPDRARWDLKRLAQSEDTDLTSAGLEDWAAALDREDGG